MDFVELKVKFLLKKELGFKGLNEKEKTKRHFEKAYSKLREVL